MVELAVAIGIVLSLVFIELIGMAAGGIIVPGYIALQLGSPDRLIGMIIISFVTFLTIKQISRITFLFGRRQMVASLLVGTLYAIVSHHLMFFNISDSTFELSAVGWVVPGLIAHWAVKQGYLKTIAMLILISVLVRFIVIIAFNGELIPTLY